MKTYVTEKSGSGYRVHKHFVFPKEPNLQSLASLVLLKRHYEFSDPVIRYKRNQEWKDYLRIKFEFLAEHKKKNGKYICVYCGRSDLNLECNNNDPRKVTIDHIIPVSRGGSRLDTSNMAVSCSKCNNKKGDSLLS